MISPDTGAQEPEGAGTAWHRVAMLKQSKNTNWIVRIIVVAPPPGPDKSLGKLVDLLVHFVRCFHHTGIGLVGTLALNKFHKLIHYVHV